MKRSPQGDPEVKPNELGRLAYLMLGAELAAERSGWRRSWDRLRGRGPYEHRFVHAIAPDVDGSYRTYWHRPLLQRIGCWLGRRRRALRYRLRGPRTTFPVTAAKLSIDDPIDRKDEVRSS